MLEFDTTYYKRHLWIQLFSIKLSTELSILGKSKFSENDSLNLVHCSLYKSSYSDRNSLQSDEASSLYLARPLQVSTGA